METVYELNCRWADRPYWREVAHAMAARTRCPDHPDVEPGRVTVVIPPEEASISRWDPAPPRTLAHPKPILWLDCGAPGCRWFASFDRRALPAEVLPEPAVT